MIQFEKVNEKGERLHAYTHRNYLSKSYNTEICHAERRNQTLVNVAFYGTTIISYWAVNKVSKLNSFVTNKIAWKGKFLIVSALAGLATSFFTSLVLANSLRNTHENLLKKQIFPAWLNKERVVNPERVFFQLDDNNNNEPNIYHSGITHEAIQRLTPDFLVGNPQKPHYPVAEAHHH